MAARGAEQIALEKTIVRMTREGRFFSASTRQALINGWQAVGGDMTNLPLCQTWTGKGLNDATSLTISIMGADYRTFC